MAYNPANPLIVQGDRPFCSRSITRSTPRPATPSRPSPSWEKSPEHIHTYRLSPLSLWNAAAAGISADEMVDALATYSKFPLPPNLPVDIKELVGRYGE